VVRQVSRLSFDSGELCDNACQERARVAVVECGEGPEVLARLRKQADGELNDDVNGDRQSC
jgi:hypothetical protein